MHRKVSKNVPILYFNYKITTNMEIFVVIKILFIYISLNNYLKLKELGFI